MRRENEPDAARVDAEVSFEARQKGPIQRLDRAQETKGQNAGNCNQGRLRCAEAMGSPGTTLPALGATGSKLSSAQEELVYGEQDL